MTAKQEAIIKCPFFQGSRKDIIACESYIGSAVMLTKFADVAAMSEHVRQYCVREDGGRCPLAMSLYDKYEQLERAEEARQKRRREMNLKE